MNFISATLDRPDGPLECIRWHETGCAAEGWGFYIVYIDGQCYVRDPDDF